MIIGTFKKTDETIQGVIHTLTLTAEVALEPLEKSTDNAPDYRITAGQREIGVAWKKTSEAGNAYYSMQIDDPSFAAPINCALVKTSIERGYNLIWDRKRKRS